MTNEILRAIPKTDEFLRIDGWANLVARYPASIAKEMLRNVLSDLRREIQEGKKNTVPSVDDIIACVEARTREFARNRLKRVINGTGVVIHTNLGRSLLAPSAIDAVMNAARYYTNLEYDLKKGGRGDRYEHCLSILRKITGAESALVVNNNAAAVFLVLNTIAEDKEVVISRGELIEIGGSFRIPEVMRKSGVILKEVGTTNRTYRQDYEGAISDKTGLLMMANTSNYKIKGFVHTTPSQEIAALGRQYGIPTYYDAGSGVAFPLRDIGIRDEPVITEEIRKGIDILSCSGDKLLGGPQAGVILGTKPLLDMMKRNPLARALRPDKLTIAALESTLHLYLDKDKAKQEVPTLRMISEEPEIVRKRARQIARGLKKRCRSLLASVVDVSSEVGGGSLPDTAIPSAGISIQLEGMSVQALEQRLRALDVPIIGRIEKDRLILDARTLLNDDIPLVVAGLEAVAGDGK